MMVGDGVTILILIDGFLQYQGIYIGNAFSTVTILILIDGFLQLVLWAKRLTDNEVVTILILIDGFLQYMVGMLKEVKKVCHNPYFNRWFSAITKAFTLKAFT